MRIKNFMPECPVKSLNIGILVGLPGLNMNYPDIMLLTPFRWGSLRYLWSSNSYATFFNLISCISLIIFFSSELEKFVTGAEGVSNILLPF